jgi:hypothetical protein
MLRPARPAIRASSTPIQNQTHAEPTVYWQLAATASSMKAKYAMTATLKIVELATPIAAAKVPAWNAKKKSLMQNVATASLKQVKLATVIVLILAQMRMPVRSMC